jgi:hypothetical protein
MGRHDEEGFGTQSIYLRIADALRISHAHMVIPSLPNARNDIKKPIHIPTHLYGLLL